MENIVLYSDGVIKATTITKENKSEVSLSNDNLVVSFDKPISVASADEVLIVCIKEDKKGFALIHLSKKESFDEVLLSHLETLSNLHHFNIKESLFIFAPAAGFSHVEISEDEIKSLVERGYRMAAKRTSGVDYFDAPIMNHLILRNHGVKAENILLPKFDTFETEGLLYSEARGDIKKNPTIVEFIKG